MHFKCHAQVLGTLHVLYRTDQFVVVVPLGLYHSLGQERYGSQDIWPRPLAQVEELRCNRMETLTQVIG